MTAALRALAAAAAVAPGWEVEIEKSIPVAAGLGGGSSDAATALRLANDLLPEPLPDDELEALAAGIGADVPFFLREGPQLGRGDGTSLTALGLPAGYDVLLLLPNGAEKESTAAVYARFDERGGHRGFDGRAGGPPRGARVGGAPLPISPCCPRTTSPAHRSPESCSSWVRSVRM